MFTDISSPTIIAEGTQIHGSVTFFSSVYIAGLVEGDLAHQSLEKLQIGKTGWIRGSIQAQGPVVVEGKVEGSIYSSTAIRLSSTAQVKGKLVSPAIQITPGALVEGEISMEALSTRHLQTVKEAA